ncbi:MAG TPA: hypothetical protein VEP90_25765 [Methylomirabilota bacterium]|nr:hypothetical protein [Methylomirabilota bacterium]
MTLKAVMMGEQFQELDGFQPGDKIRVRVGPHTGARGIIQAELDGLLEIQLDESNSINVPIKDVTNYSLAARRAWQVMPKRSGRPQLPAPRKKMVSFRLDIDVWDQLGEAVELGLIPSREQAINVWLRQQLDSLFNGESSPNTPHE